MWKTLLLIILIALQCALFPRQQDTETAAIQAASASLQARSNSEVTRAVSIQMQLPDTHTQRAVGGRRQPANIFRLQISGEIRALGGLAAARVKQIKRALYFVLVSVQRVCVLAEIRQGCGRYRYVVLKCWD